MKNIYIIFCLSFLFFSCKKNNNLNTRVSNNKDNTEDINRQNDSTNTNNTYKLAEVQYSNSQDELTLNGEVSFDEDSVVRVFPLVSGKVEKVNVQLGSLVKRGQELAVIKSADVTGFVKDFEVNKANFEITKKNLKNTESLFQSGFASEGDLLSARQEHLKAEQELSRSREILRIYGGATKSDQPYFVVKAPISGYIVQKNLATGQELRSDNSNEMFMISNLRKVWVLANVYETDIAEVEMGQQVEIKTISYPDKTFKGTISNISNVLDKDSRVMKIRVEMDNAAGLLKPDMFATIHLHLAKSEKMLSVPLKAVVFDNDRYFVIVEKEGKYEKRQVEILKNTSRSSFLKGNLKAGEKVVTEGSLLIFNELNG
jgi:membrane fusion protein, heavy metal efflux system